MQLIILNCVTGLANRLNNIINIEYISRFFPKAIFYIWWPTNNHFALDLNSVLDIKKTYPNINCLQISNRDLVEYKRKATWIEVNKKDITKWPKIVYITSYHLINESDATIIKRIVWVPNIENRVTNIMKLHNIDNNTTSIHVRFGDLLQLVCDNKNIDINKVKLELINKVKQLNKSFLATDDPKLSNMMSHQHIVITKTFPQTINRIQTHRSVDACLDGIIDFIILTRTRMIFCTSYSDYSKLAWKSHGNLSYTEDLFLTAI